MGATQVRRPEERPRMIAIRVVRFKEAYKKMPCF
jgi:hypothetical protein